jgi:hypothetical protein
MGPGYKVTQSSILRSIKCSLKIGKRINLYREISNFKINKNN